MRFVHLARGLALSLGALAAASAQAAGNIQITEWMYNGSEFIEFTNVGDAAVDFNGWSFDDDSNTPGMVSLTAFGSVAAGESVILSQDSASVFSATWGLSSTVKVIGGNTNNLGRNDQINLYDNANNLIDRLTFGDQNIAGTIRTDVRSGNPTSLLALAGQSVTPTTWVLASTGDAYGSVTSTTGGFIANPGTFALAAVPEPTGLVLALGGLAWLGSTRRRAR